MQITACFLATLYLSKHYHFDKENDLQKLKHPTWFLYTFSRFDEVLYRRTKNIVRGFLRFPLFSMRKSIKCWTVFIVISIHFKTLKYSKYSMSQKSSTCFQFY